MDGPAAPAPAAGGAPAPMAPPMGDGSDGPHAAGPAAPAPAAGAAARAPAGLLQVTSTTRPLADATEASLSLSVRNPVGLRNLTLQLEPPPSLSMSLAAPPPAAITGNRVTIPFVAGGASGAVAVTLTSQAALADVAVQGQVSYVEPSAGSEPRILPFKLTLSPAELLRPHKISTAEYGQLWPSHAAERKQMVATAKANDANAFQQTVERNSLAHVERIGMEALFCGRLAGSQHYVLVHGKLGQMNGRAVELTVRSREPRFTEHVLRRLSEQLA